jgi:hypothetical protein
VSPSGKILLNDLVNPGSVLSAKTRKEYPVTDALLQSKPSISGLVDALVSFISGKIVIAFDLAFNVNSFPKEAVTSIAGFHTYMDFQKTLSSRTAALKTLAVKLGFKWDDVPSGSLREPQALRTVWAHLAECHFPGCLLTLRN